MLTLYHYWSSVCSQKVRILLAEKALEWESAHVDLFTFEQWTPRYLALNPKGVVPALDHDGFIVTESNIICEYLEDLFPEPSLRPGEARARARVRKWMLHSEEDLHSAIAMASFNKRHRARMLAKYSLEELRERLARAPATELAATAIERLEAGLPADKEDAAYRQIDRVLSWMEDALDPGPWLLGEVYSLADIAMAPYINRVEVLDRPQSIASKLRPRLAAWWQRVQGRPAYRQAMAFRNPDRSDPLAR